MKYGTPVLNVVISLTGDVKAVEMVSIVINVSGNTKIDEVRGTSISVNRLLCAGGGQPMAQPTGQQLLIYCYTLLMCHFSLF